jgi:hypothetical protein
LLACSWRPPETDFGSTTPMPEKSDNNSYNFLFTLSQNKRQEFGEEYFFQPLPARSLFNSGTFRANMLGFKAGSH